MINFISPVNQLSYGITGLNVLKSLSKLIPVCLWPIGNIQLESKDDEPFVKAALALQDEYDVNAPCVRLYHQFSLAEFVGKGPRFGWPIFELDKFSKRERHHISSVDQVIVCSKWAADIVKDQTGRDAKVVPLGVESDRVFFPANPPLKPKDDFTFIITGKIELRKNYDIIPHLFKSAFNLDKRYKLRMIWGNPFMTADEIKEWENFYKSELGDQVSFLGRVHSQHQIAEEMRRADAGLCLSKSEGWDLPALEMLSVGLPIIATNVSAHTEFLTEDNSYLIDCPDKEIAEDGRWFHSSGSWAFFGEKEQEQTILAMRGVGDCENTATMRKRARETALKFSWTNTAQSLYKIINNE